jgi:hypothetical protein
MRVVESWLKEKLFFLYKVLRGRSVFLEFYIISERRRTRVACAVVCFILEILISWLSCKRLV